jgi:hypothetical protein
MSKVYYLPMKVISKQYLTEVNIFAYADNHACYFIKNIFLGSLLDYLVNLQNVKN